MVRDPTLVEILSEPDAPASISCAHDAVAARLGDVIRSVCATVRFGCTVNDDPVYVSDLIGAYAGRTVGAGATWIRFVDEEKGRGLLAVLHCPHPSLEAELTLLGHRGMLTRGSIRGLCRWAFYAVGLGWRSPSGGECVAGSRPFRPAALLRRLRGQRGGRAQQIGDEFASRQAGEIDAARSRLQAMAARGGVPIDNPAVAFEAVADRARQVGGRYADDVRQAETAQGEALRAVRGDGSADVLDGATIAVQGARDAAGQARAAYGQAYDDLDAVLGTFAPDAFSRVGARIRSMLGPETPIAPTVTPAASRALDLIESMGQQLGLRTGEGPTLQQVNLIRKGISNLYGATGQNGTDRAALGAVRDAFDRHVQDMTEIGLFRSGPAPRGPAVLGDDAAAAAGRGVEPPPPDAIPLPAAREGEPESLIRYLARNGGIPLDDEARAADLNRLYVPGAGALARRNSSTWDQIRVRLAEQGFFPGDDMAGASPRDVADRVREAIRAERQGRPTVRMNDEGAAGARRGAERVSDENAEFAAQVDREARRLAIDLEGYGLTGSNLDRAALREAAEARVLGRSSDDGITAYDAAVAGGRAADRGGTSGGAVMGAGS